MDSARPKTHVAVPSTNPFQSPYIVKVVFMFFFSHRECSAAQVGNDPMYVVYTLSLHRKLRLWQDVSYPMML